MYAYTHSPLAKIWCVNLKKARTLFLKQNFMTDLTVLSQRTERINSYFNRIQTDRCCQILSIKICFPNWGWYRFQSLQSYAGLWFSLKKIKIKIFFPLPSDTFSLEAYFQFFFSAPQQTRGFWPLQCHNNFTFSWSCPACWCTEFALGHSSEPPKT